MSARHQSEAITMIKSLGNILSKSVTGTTRRNTPTAPVVGVGPQKVAHGTLVGHLLKTVQSANVVQSVNAGTQTTMKAENLRKIQKLFLGPDWLKKNTNLSINECCEWQVVK